MSNSIMRKGQGSLEYLVLLGVSMVIFLVVVSVVNDQLQIIGAQKTADNARFALKQIADTATDVYQQGRGASKIITVTFPEGVDVGSPQIINSTVMLSIKGSYISYTLDFPFSGALPPKGTTTLILTSQGGSVVAGVLPFTVSPASMSYDVCALGAQQTKSQKLLFTNQQNVSTPVSVTTTWVNGSVRLDYLPSSFTIPVGGSVNVSVDVTIDANTVGFFSGIIIANTTVGANYSVPIPVTVQVVSCGVVTGVTDVVVSTYKNSSYTTTKTAFGAAENVTLLASGWPPSSAVTLDVRYPNGTSVSGYPTSKIANGTGGFSDTFDAFGFPSGTYSAIANSSINTQSSTFILRGCN